MVPRQGNVGGHVSNLQVVIRTGTGQEYYFLCGKWLGKDEEDGLLERELTAQLQDGVASLPYISYRVTVVTGNRKGAGMKFGVWESNSDVRNICQSVFDDIWKQRKFRSQEIRRRQKSIRTWTE